MGERIHSRIVKAAAVRLLEQRGVTLEAIADIVFELQAPYHPQLAWSSCMDSVRRVLEKRELLHALLVGIELDVLAERGLLSQPLQSIVEADEGLFGCDETLALGAVFAYGSIAVTTFGYLDKCKTGIIRQLDTKAAGKVHTFLDDLVASIASSAASRLAHRLRDTEEDADGGLSRPASMAEKEAEDETTTQ
ncbi:MAG: phosphatidylglycerophosphatase [Paenibacillaceae bacterium]|nr:phosphatidylglycerophosphatase [Paenibacillaceae bacterium]